MSTDDRKTKKQLIQELHSLRHKVAVILMDINLPGMNGIEALKELKNTEETRTIPVVALSANAMERDKRKGLEAGFHRYLTKPIDVVEVLAGINSALDEAIFRRESGTKT
jgi:CheY-like chemotaxis protein